METRYTAIFCLFFAFLVGLLTYLDLNLLIIPGVAIGLILLYFLIKNDKFLLILTIYVFIIDAGNGLLPIPLREITFMILILKLLHYCIKRKFKDSSSLPIIIISIFVPIYGITISAFRGNNLSYAFDDAKGYMFLLTALGLTSIIYFNNQLKQVLIKHFIIASLIISITTIVILFLALSGAVSIYDSGLWLREYSLGFAGIEVNGENRIFLRAQLYVMFSLILVTSMFYSKSHKNKKTLLFLILIFAACIIISNTRGLWLGSIIGLGLLFILSKFTVRKLIGVYFLILILVPTYPLYSDFVDKAYTRLKSSFEFSQLESNAIRNQQSSYLLLEFEKYPIFGKGFGSTLSTNYVRSEEVPYSFELSYFEILYKLGLVGSSMFAIAILLFFRVLLKSKSNDITVQKGVLFSFIGFMFLSSTNPYIVSSLGIFLLSILYVVSKGQKQELA